MISYSRYPFNHKHISWLTIPCTCLISQDSLHLCDDLVPIIYKQVSLNSPASENREPCTILKTLRKCPYSPVVVCSLIPICCSPDFPDHFSLSPQHFICCPRIRSHCFQTQTSLYPPLFPQTPRAQLETQEQRRLLGKKGRATFGYQLAGTTPLSGSLCHTPQPALCCWNQCQLKWVCRLPNFSPCL